MTTLPIDSIKVGERVRQNLGAITELAVSIDEIGLLHPVVVNRDCELVAGARRLAAVKSLGWADVAVTVVDSLESFPRLTQAERDENTCRLDFSPTEAAEMRKKVAAALAPKAAESKGGRPKKETGGKLPPVKAAKTRDAAAVGTGFSGKTLDKVDHLKDLAENSPIPQLRSDAKRALERMDSTGKVDPEFKKITEAEQLAAAVERFPFLADVPAPVSQVLSTAAALEALDGPELERRADSARKWADMKRRKAGEVVEPPNTAVSDALDALVKFNVLVPAALDGFANGHPFDDPLGEWPGALTLAVKHIDELRSATKPSIRRIK